MCLIAGKYGMLHVHVCHMIITSKLHGVDVIGMIESGFTCRPQKLLNILSFKGGIYK